MNLNSKTLDFGLRTLVILIPFIFLFYPYPLRLTPYPSRLTPYPSRLTPYPLRLTSYAYAQEQAQSLPGYSQALPSFPPGTAKLKEAGPAPEPPSPSSETYYYERKTVPYPLMEKGPSRIEEFFKGKLPPGKEELEQFGYDFFLPKGEEIMPASNIPVSKDYILGPGDTLQIYTWGNIVPPLLETTVKTPEYDYSRPMEIKVNRDGGIFLPQIGLIHVWGTSLGELGVMLLERLSQQMKGFEIGVALARPRTFPVYVVGEARRPGPVMVNGVSTAIEALIAAGGVKKNGSLRNLILRKGQEEYQIDLYDFLIFGKGPPIFLSEGAVILVPPLGPTFLGIAGNVARPGIYEIKPPLTISEALSLAGGALPSGSLDRVQVERFSENEKKVALDIDLSKAQKVSFPLQGGDLVKVFPVYDIPENVVHLEGNVKKPGTYQYKERMNLSHLIPGSETLLPETYMEYAEIIRREGPDLHPITIPFSLSELINKKIDFPLRPLDRVKVFSAYAFPRVEVSGKVRRPGVYPFWPGMKLSSLLAQAGGITESPENLKAELLTAEELGLELGVEPGREIEKKETKVAKEFRSQRVVYLMDLLVKNKEELNFSLKPGDKVIVKLIEEKERQPTVYLIGEVKHPGEYPIKKEERISSVFERARGFTDKAYVDGIVFTRESTRDREDAARSQALNFLRKELLAENVLAAREEYKSELGFSVSRARPKDESRAVGLTPAFPPETNVYGAMGGYDFQKELIDQIFSGKTIGRALLRVTKDLDKFKGSPSDIPLEDGDIIFIPKEPRHILVMGEVYNQASILYQEGKSLAYYLSQAGGPTKRADKDSLFVIRPDGSVVSKAAVKENKGVEVWDAEAGKWEKIKDFKKMALKPGDAIIVPMEFEEEKKLSKQVKDVTQSVWQGIATLGVLGVLLF